VVSASSRTLWACALIAGVCFLAYAPVYTAWWLADDFAYARMYAGRPFADWVAIVATDWTRGVWGYPFDELRSMLALAFWWDGRLWPLHPAGYHFTSVLFHAASSIMVFLLARTIFAGAMGVSFVAGLLFALHPVHAEAVDWISGRADPMCTFFSLASLWTYALYRERPHRTLYAVSLAAFVLALFSKEVAIAFPLLPLGYDLFRKGRVRPAATGYFAVLGAYLLLRRAVFPHAIREDQLNLGVVREFVRRQAEYAHFLVPVLPLVLVALLCVAAVYVLRRRWEWLFFGPWWYLVCVAPLIVTYSSPRHLYLASVGLCLLVPVLIPRRGFVIVAACLLAASGGLLVRQNLRWRFAGDSSARARVFIEEFARTIPAGSGLILDIPEALGPQYLWLSSLPFALEPPYGSGTVYRQFRVIERPLAYQYWSGSTDGTGRTWMEDRQPVLQDLVAHPAECYRVTMDESGAITTTRVPPAVLAGLLGLVSRYKPHDSIFDFNGKWVAFWRKV
jgi:hypothetical protein